MVWNLISVLEERGWKPGDGARSLGRATELKFLATTFESLPALTSPTGYSACVGETLSSDMGLVFRRTIRTCGRLGRALVRFLGTSKQCTSEPCLSSGMPSSGSQCLSSFPEKLLWPSYSRPVHLSAMLSFCVVLLSRSCRGHRAVGLAIVQLAIGSHQPRIRLLHEGFAVFVLGICFFVRALCFSDRGVTHRHPRMVVHGNCGQFGLLADNVAPHM